MAWLDSRVWCHPKLNALTDRGFRVHINAIAYSDGFGTRGVLSPADQRTIGATPKVRAELVNARLWDEKSDGSIVIHDWSIHNGKRDERREVDRERKRAARAKASAGQSNGASAGQSMGRAAGHDADKAADRRTLTGDRVKDEELHPAAALTTTAEPEPADANNAAAAFEKQRVTIERLHELGIDPEEVLPYGFPLIEAWIDLADREATLNAGAFALGGIQTGRMPSPRKKAPSVDPTERRRRYVERTGWQLDPDHLETELVDMGAQGDELVGLLELAADLRQEHAAA